MNLWFSLQRSSLIPVASHVVTWRLNEQGEEMEEYEEYVNDAIEATGVITEWGQWQLLHGRHLLRVRPYQGPVLLCWFPDAIVGNPNIQHDDETCHLLVATRQCLLYKITTIAALWQRTSCKVFTWALDSICTEIWWCAEQRHFVALLKTGALLHTNISTLVTQTIPLGPSNLLSLLKSAVWSDSKAASATVVRGLALLPDKVLVFSGDCQLRLWSLTTHTVLRPFFQLPFTDNWCQTDLLRLVDRFAVLWPNSTTLSINDLETGHCAAIIQLPFEDWQDWMDWDIVRRGTQWEMNVLQDHQVRHYTFDFKPSSKQQQIYATRSFLRDAVWDILDHLQENFNHEMAAASDTCPISEQVMQLLQHPLYTDSMRERLLLLLRNDLDSWIGNENDNVFQLPLNQWIEMVLNFVKASVEARITDVVPQSVPFRTVEAIEREVWLHVLTQWLSVCQDARKCLALGKELVLRRDEMTVLDSLTKYSFSLVFACLSEEAPISSIADPSLRCLVQVSLLLDRLWTAHGTVIVDKKIKDLAFSLARNEIEPIHVLDPEFIWSADWLESVREPILGPLEAPTSMDASTMRSLIDSIWTVEQSPAEWYQSLLHLLDSLQTFDESDECNHVATELVCILYERRTVAQTLLRVLLVMTSLGCQTFLYNFDAVLTRSLHVYLWLEVSYQLWTLPGNIVDRFLQEQRSGPWALGQILSLTTSYFGQPMIPLLLATVDAASIDPSVNVEVARHVLNQVVQLLQIMQVHVSCVASALYVLGCVHSLCLEENEAVRLFDRASVAMILDSNEEMKRQGSLWETVWDRLQPNQKKQQMNGRVLFYQHVMNWLLQLPQCKALAVTIGEKALKCLESLSNVGVQKSVLASNVFSAALDTLQYRRAFDALKYLNDQEQQLSLLSRWVVVLCDQKDESLMENVEQSPLSVLCQVPRSLTFSDEIEKTLRFRATSASIESLLAAGKRNYYLILSAYLIHLGNYHSAADVMYHYAVRLQSFPVHEALVESCKAYLMVKQSLVLAGKDDRIAVRRVVGDDEKVHILDAAAVDREYKMAMARLLLFSYFPSVTATDAPLVVSEVVALLLRLDYFERALSLSVAWDVDLSAVFVDICTKCLLGRQPLDMEDVEVQQMPLQDDALVVAAGGVHDVKGYWRLLQLALEQYDASDMRYRLVAVEVFLSQNDSFVCPEWLVNPFQTGHYEDLARVYVRCHRLQEAAHLLTLIIEQKSKRIHASVSKTFSQWLPYTVINQLIAEMRKTPIAEHVEKEFHTALREYLRKVERASMALRVED